jgi:proteasome lid subunit RPN8/RPN11
MDIQEQILEHAKECYPLECCGLIVIVKGRKIYKPCRNIASGFQFAIHPQDFADAEDAGVIDTVVHSHPNSSPMPSPADLIGCEQSGLKWMIMSYPSGNVYEFEPTSYVMPLFGRSFQHGTVDCFTFIRDYYKQELNIDMPDYDRKDNWWLSGESHYIDRAKDAGFYSVDDLQVNDVILMQVASPVPNHGAIYVGGNKIAHHQVGRLSSIDVYGGWYSKITSGILRHTSSKQ